MSRLDEIEAFVRSHADYVADWEPGRVREYLRWFLRRECVGVVRRAGRIVAAGIGYPVRTRRRPKTPYSVDWQGRHLWVEMVVACDPEAVAGLWELLLARFRRPRQWVGFARVKYEQRVRWYRIDIIRRKFQTQDTRRVA